MSARVIWMFEKLGWVREVRWPTTRRLAARRLAVLAAPGRSGQG